MIGFKRNAFSLSAGDLDRGAFVAYFLGAVVPLAALGFVIGRHTEWMIAPLGDALALGPLEPAHLLGLFCGISSLSMASFLLLRQLVKRAIEENRRLAHFDPLTGLPNRRLFQDRTNQTLFHSKREGVPFAVFFLDLDGFKRVNDTLGHIAGDELLSQMAQRLVSIMRDSDVVARSGLKDTEVGVARMGGDEFTLLLPGLHNPSDAERVARRLLEEVAVPFQVLGHELFVTLSIGIALYPLDGDDVETLLKSADTAMYCSKESGRNGFKFFSASMNDECIARLEMEENLRHALAHDELSLHFQPIRDAKTGRVVAAEALARWVHAELGSIAPTEFISVAEDAGLIDSLGEWALREACRQSRAWQEAGLKPIRIAVNVSGHQARKPGFVDKVREIVQETGLSVAHLELEITESTIMQDDQLIDDAFNALSDMGISIALDDFGTGYSSLTYLRRFPVSRVKIDRSFVEGIPGDVENLAISAAILSMAHHLLMSVVAEGVETQAQAEALRELGCEELQGFLFSPAVAAQDFLRFLEPEKP